MQQNQLPAIKSNFSHHPPHDFTSTGSYMVTCGTIGKQHLFNTPEKKFLLQDTLLNIAAKYNWSLTAWAIFSNHYHFIGKTVDSPQSLPIFINKMHNISALHLNKMDDQLGRNVWFQYYDSKLNFKNSYYARLNYVINNPVKHKLVENAIEYPWCSAAWFKETANKEFRKKVEGFKWDFVKVDDDY
jgi:putative transposase